MTPSLINEWNKKIEYAFPDFYGRVQCFTVRLATGRIFAVDSGRLEGYSGVVMFEPGTGRALEIHTISMTFHNNRLVDAARL